MKARRYPLLILLLALPARAGTPDCDRSYAELAQRAADRVRDRFTVGKSEAPGLVARYRDQLRDLIMYWKNRPYSITTMDDATPVKANLLAKAAVGNKAALEGAPFKTAEIKEELAELLRLTERYPKDFVAFLEDTATKQARLEAMERALRQGIRSSRDLELLMPVTRVDDQGSVVEVGMKKLTWSTRTKFDLELSSLRREMRRRSEGPRFWQSRQEAYALEARTAEEEPVTYDAMEHIYRVKKLDAYRGEYRDLLNRMASHREPVTIDPELKALYDRVEALYDAATGGLKKDYHAPYWAWQRLRWQEIAAELKTIVLKDRIDLGNNETTKAVVSYLKNLSPEERKALGIDKLAGMFTFMGKNIYVRTLMGLGGSLLGSGGIVSKGLDVWNQIRLESAEKEACAAKPSDAKFRECAQEFLQSKFTVAAIKTVVFGEESFLDDTSRIKDPQVRAEVDDLIRRRKTYLGNEIQRKENQDALDKAIKDVQGAQDPGSDAFREKLITAPRPEIFVFGLTGGDDKTTLYLGFRHPGQFQKHRELVLQALSEADADRRRALLDQLRDGGAAGLADDVDGLVADREDYLADPDRYLKRGRRKTAVKPKAPDAEESGKTDKTGKDGQPPDTKKKSDN